MQRMISTPRTDWQSKVGKLGLTFHTLSNGKPYWNELVYYQFTAAEIDILEAATNKLQECFLEAGQYIIDNNRFADLGIPESTIPLIKWAWEEEPPAIYGRFDLSYDGVSSPKLLEYNADTPTSLLEASVVQWFWKEECFSRSDQFNSIHEKLVAKWTELRDYITEPLYFTHINDDSLEDTMTVSYLRDTAEEAGIKTGAILIKDIGWNGDNFVDIGNFPITSIFKLYPWEWLVHEKFGQYLLQTYKSMQWIEPIWKMMFSNKGILPILWEMYPHHPNLLEAYFDTGIKMVEYVRKPKLSREGANIQIIQNDTLIKETEGDYGEEGYIYQRLKTVDFDGFHPVIGSWVIDGVSAGIGIRESDQLITDNLSTFVPHKFD